MRSISIAAVLLIGLATPVLAHEGSHGLLLEDLAVTFDPLTQAQVFTFNLTNTHATQKTGLIEGQVLLVTTGPVAAAADETTEGSTPVNTTIPARASIDVIGLAPGEKKEFSVKLALRFSLEGCIQATSTARGETLASDMECAANDGLTQARASSVETPEAPEVPEEPPALPSEAPEIPTLPPAEPPTLP